MAHRRNCKHQGFSYARDGYKDIRIVCDYDGEIHNKDYCKTCQNYIPRIIKKKWKKVLSDGKVY